MQIVVNDTNPFTDLIYIELTDVFFSLLLKFINNFGLKKSRLYTWAKYSYFLTIKIQEHGSHCYKKRFEEPKTYSPVS